MYSEQIGSRACYLGMAEEAAELSAICNKLIRIVDGDNPSPMTEGEAQMKVREEFTHLWIYATELGICPSIDTIFDATKRFKERMKAEEIKGKLRKEVSEVGERGELSRVPIRAINYTLSSSSDDHITGVLHECFRHTNCDDCPIMFCECEKIANKVRTRFEVAKERIRNDNLRESCCSFEQGRGDEEDAI